MSMAGVHGEFAYTMGDFQNIALLVKAGSGIDLPQSKATLVYSRLAKRVREHSLSTFKEYCDLVREDDNERHRMIAALTTNVTKFFREQHHFDHLLAKTVTPMAAGLRRGDKLRIWSSACSSGQEPYSIALTLLAAIPEAPKLDIRILATDLNPFMVDHGRRGAYEASELDTVPAALRAKWFSPVPDEAGMFQIASEARSLVSFRQLNLMERWPMSGKFHAIYCRNVAIYFDRDTQDRLWARLSELLLDNAYLYIGHSERVAAEQARRLRSDGITTYVRTGGVDNG
ncbi:MAG: protein-glutamate O-methyltransferase CheR [Hyphomicrobium sp.]